MVAQTSDTEKTKPQGGAYLRLAPRYPRHRLRLLPRHLPIASEKWQRETTGAEGNVNDRRMFSIARLEGISTRGGEEVEKSMIEGLLEDGTLEYILSIKASRVRSLGAPESGRLWIVEQWLEERSHQKVWTASQLQTWTVVAHRSACDRKPAVGNCK